jgi:hypothetical protein
MCAYVKDKMNVTRDEVNYITKNILVDEMRKLK